MTITVTALLAGMALGAALLVLVGAFTRTRPHLASTLTALRGDLLAPVTTPGSGDIPSDGGLVDRWGGWLLRSARIRPTTKQLAQLRLRGISLTRFYGERLASALLCPLLVVMVMFTVQSFGVQLGVSVPVGAVLAAAVFGWFLPALRVASSARHVEDDASEALLVFIDLVILERMANQHAKDALTRAAQVSDNPLFLQIQSALARAELEREQPWTKMRRLADRLGLPQLADIADIARLQEEGGSLSAAFRARVAELRNAHLTRSQREADRITQRMEVPKILPVMVVSIILVLPPLMRIAFS